MSGETWRTERRRPRPRRGATVSAHLVILAESDRPAAGSSRHRLAGLEEVVLGRSDERAFQRSGRRLTIGIPDNRMSRVHARLRATPDGWTLEDASSRNGTILNGEACTTSEISDGDVVELGHTSLLFRDLEEDEILPVDCDAATLDKHLPFLTSFAPALLRVYTDLRRIAPTPVSILLTGETGCGKEVIARAIHAMSGRSGAFVAVNCGALPATLVESELFGHKKGAFSGAHADRPGLARTAEGGTLFLDEIGDLSPQSQAALLRMLQEREVMPLGGSTPVPIDVKVVSATHRDVEAMGEPGFRRDLYARIAGYTVSVPPLRERREDLGLLVQALLARIATDPDRPLTLDVETMRSLVWHEWPLNVRELESALRVGAALATDGVVLPHHLPEAVQAAPPSAPDQALSPDERRRRDHLAELLKMHRGNVSAVARASGKARVQIQRWLRRYALNPTDYK